MAINISLVAGKDKDSSSISASGTEEHLITGTERSTFRVHDNGLKNAINSYFGKRPDDAFLTSPTPWGDLYQVYGWNQVKCLSQVQRAEILELASTPTIVASKEFSNNSSKPATFTGQITDTVTNTVMSTWSTGGTLTFGQKLNYSIKVGDIGVGGETSFSYSQSWSVGGSTAQAVALGSNGSVQVLLAPGESVIAQLSASRGSLKARLSYRSYLVGATAANYSKRHKNSHFWALPIGAVMKAGGIRNQILSTEDVSVSFYTSFQITLMEKKTGRMLATYNVDDTPANVLFDGSSIDDEAPVDKSLAE